MEKVPFTINGLENLKNEFNNLKKIQRPEIIKAISIAREHGDLSENAEYHAAKEKQSFIEGRITELESVLSRAEVIDLTKLDGKRVTFGTKVIFCLLILLIIFYPINILIGTNIKYEYIYLFIKNNLLEHQRFEIWQNALSFFSFPGLFSKAFYLS